MNLTTVVSPSAILFLLVVLGGLPWLAIRRGWIFPGSRFQKPVVFLPAKAPSPNRIACRIEAAVLGIAGLLVFAVAATTRNTGGYLFNLDELAPDYATINVILFVCAAIGVALAILVALWGRTVAGTIVMGVVLVGYGTVLNVPRHPGAWFLPKQRVEPRIEYTFDFSRPNVRGAELWINGVRLGEMPYTTTLAELNAKVPQWSKPPADFKTAMVKTRQDFSPNGESYSEEKQWVSFELPFLGSQDMSYPPTIHPYQNPKTYYARVRYAGQWAGQSGMGHSGTQNERGTTQFIASFSVSFPEREKRLSTLLNLARLADYRVGLEWFEAIETYHQDGATALYEAAEREPRMMEVLDAWATRRYGLDKVTDAESAWSAFQQICDEADARREYFSESAAGRAVELLLPKLPQTKLVDKAVKLIEAYHTKYELGSLSWSYSTNGRFRFGSTDRLGATDANSQLRNRWFSDTNRQAGPYPQSAFAVAHAVILLNERLRYADDQSEPNILQRKIAPAIIRSLYRYKQYAWDHPMQAVVEIGGPEVDQFLLRQKWWAKPEQLDWSERNRLGGSETNIWLYFLANLNDEAGQSFRRPQASAIMDMADEIVGNSWTIFSGLPSSMDFIFIDPGFAKKYLPRFIELTQRKPHEYPIWAQWRYLVRLGDAADSQMFVETWKNAEIEIGYMPFRMLDQLKPRMRQEVVDALVKQIEDTSEDKLVSKYKFRGVKEQVLNELYQHAGKQQIADRLFAKLQPGVPAVPEDVFRNAAIWLAHTQPDSPLVAMLVNADKPELRMLAIDALQEFPTPQHREFLEKLLQDPDATVRTGAEKASGNLKKLTARKPAEFVSDATTTPNTPSITTTSKETN